MAVDMFFKIKGIEGESKDSKHTNDIDVLAWSWGESNSGSFHHGGGGGRQGERQGRAGGASGEGALQGFSMRRHGVMSPPLLGSGARMAPVWTGTVDRTGTGRRRVDRDCP